MIFVHYQIVCSENSTQQSEEVPLTTLPMGPLPVGPPSFWVIICLDWTHLDCWTFRPEKFSIKFELTEKSENLSTNKIIQDGQSCVVSTSTNPSPLPQQLSKFFHPPPPPLSAIISICLTPLCQHLANPPSTNAFKEKAPFAVTPWRPFGCFGQKISYYGKIGLTCLFYTLL